jgi:hypothetical protein
MKFEIEDKGPAAGLADLASELYPALADPASELYSADIYSEDLPLDDLPTPLTLAVAADRVGIGPDAVEMALLDASRFSGVSLRREFGKKASMRLAIWLHLADPEQLSKERVKVPWFASHAPRNGGVRVQHATSSSRGGEIGFDVFGSTMFRAGRSFAATASDDTGLRKVCSMSSLILEGAPTRYHYRGNTSAWELDELKLIEGQDEDLDPCPFCSIRPDEINMTEHDTDPPEDRRKTKSSRDFGDKYEWTKNFSFSIPIPIPIPNLPVPMTVNIGFSATTAVTWELNGTLAGGYRYQAYWNKGHSRVVPPMWAAER